MSRPIYFEILTEKPEKIVEFYRQTLGWEPAIGQGPQNYWMVSTGPDDRDGINGGIMHRHFPQAVINTIEVESLEATIAKIETAGGKKIHGPNEIPEVGLHAYCADPDGNLFGVMQRR